MTPAAAVAPNTPAKNTAKATGTVTSAAITTDPLTAVPITISGVAISASIVWAISFSRRVPGKLTKTSVASEPNAPNRAVWRLPMTRSQKANTLGATSVARSARWAATGDQVGSQPCESSQLTQRCFRTAPESAPTRLDTSASLPSRHWGTAGTSASRNGSRASA